MTAASSPPSVTLEPSRPEGCHHPAKRAATADLHAPSVALPLQFILVGAMAMVAGVVWLVARPIVLSGYHYSPEVVAVTHLFVLGWLSSVVMGTTYQIVPVALETRLHSERLARSQFVLHVVGFAGMVVMFRAENIKQVGHFGSLLAAGVGLFVYNLARTLARIPRWNVVSAGIASSLVWLSVAVLAGLYLAAAKCWNFSPFDPIAQMHAHAHLGGLGFFGLMIVALSYRLVPMFTLGEVQSAPRAKWSLVLLNAGLLGTVVTILISSPWKLLFAVILAAGLMTFGVEVMAILRGRKRRRLDWGMKYFLTALALLVPVSGMGLALAWPGLRMSQVTLQLENLYGFSAFIGVFTFATLGMLYKIVPFLVWYASYSKAVGQSQVPSPAELSPPGLAAVGYWLFLAGLVVTGVGIGLSHEGFARAGGALLLASVTSFVFNTTMVLTHLVRPRLRPLVIILGPTK
jgi:hypothetical protein